MKPRRCPLCLTLLTWAMLLSPMPRAQEVTPPTVAPALRPAPVVIPVDPAVPPTRQIWVRVKLEADALFDFDQDTLQSDGKLALDRLIMALLTVSIEAIQVTGHTDRMGSKAYNNKLSLRRAQAVQTYLVDMGSISPLKITTIGAGASQPQTQPNACKGSTATEALITCLRMDRRVEVDAFGLEPSH